MESETGQETWKTSFAHAGSVRACVGPAESTGLLTYAEL